MTKNTTILLLLATVSFAGPVADYLGIHLGRRTTSVRYGRDSTHYFYGQPDLVTQWSSVDTATVTSETTYQGNPAWLSTTVAYQYDSAVTIDTVFEQGDTMLGGCLSASTLRWHPNLYRVPFVAGQWWASGIAGTWYADFTGDGLQDTLVIAGDTVRATGTEDVRVPWDTINDCWRLLRQNRQTLYFISEGYPIVESICDRRFEWYKDSLGWVKDSGVTTGAVYVEYGGLIIEDRFVNTSWGILAEYHPAIVEDRGLTPAAARPTLEISPNPCRDRLQLTGCDQAVLYSADGRRVADLVRGTNDVTTLSPGIYALRAPGHSPVLLVKVK